MNGRVDHNGKDTVPDVGPVRILCAANAAYAAPLCVMLVSLLVNFAKEREIEIYVLATNVPGEDRRKIEASLSQNRPGFEPGSLHWLSPDLDVFKELHINRWAEIEVFARLLAPRILPADFEKVLYLDSDMVVLSDLSPLYDSRCGDSAVHAVRDSIAYVSAPTGVFNYLELGIPPQAPYFNSGVLLINLRRWREQKIADQVIDYLRLHQASVHYWDQGGLNAILHDAWTEIDPAWNQTRAADRLDHPQELGCSPVDWRRTKSAPKIIHYTGSNKPWVGRRQSGYSYFFDYLDRTAYRTAFQGPGLERLIGFGPYYFLWLVKENLFLVLVRPIKDILRPWLGPLAARIRGSLSKH